MYMNDVGIILRESIPRSQVGKILRKDLRVIAKADTATVSTKL